MRQPKFEMGAGVTIPLEVSHHKAEFSTTIRVPGTVAGVRYDPKCGTTGWPWYEYTVLPTGGNNAVSVREADVEANAGTHGRGTPRTVE
jgi:hypothetical protein